MVERSALRAAPRRGSADVRRCSSRARAEARPGGRDRADPPGQARPLRRPTRRPAARRLRDGAVTRGRPPPPARRRCVAVTARPRTGTRLADRGALSRPGGPVRRRVALVGDDRVGQVGAGPRGGPRGAGDAEIVCGRLDDRLPGHGPGDGQAVARGPAGRAPPPRRRRRPGRGVHGRGVPAGGRATRWPGSPRGAAPRRSGRRHGALPPGGGRRPRDPRPLPERPRPTSRQRPTAPAASTRLHARLADARPGRRGADRPSQPPADRAGARGRRSGLGDRSPRSVRASRPTRRPPSSRSASCSTPTRSTRRDRRALRARGWTPGCWRRFAGSRRPPADCRAPPARPSATASCWPTSRTGRRSTTAWSEAVRRTQSFARRQWSWFRRDPRITWVEPGADAGAVLSAALDAA